MAKSEICDLLLLSLILDILICATNLFFIEYCLPCMLQVCLPIYLWYCFLWFHLLESKQV